MNDTGKNYKCLSIPSQEKKCLQWVIRNLQKSYEPYTGNQNVLHFSYLQGAAVPEDTPNTETLEAMAEVDEMIKSGSGQHFLGTAEEFTDMLLSED